MLKSSFVLKFYRRWRPQVTAIPRFRKIFRFRTLTGILVVFGGYIYYLVGTDKEYIPEYYRNDFTATFMRRLPFNAVSKVLSRIANSEIPTSFRPLVFNTYATVFGCNLDEMKNADLKSYSTISHFFTRELADGIRPIDSQAALVSPADGKILHFGPVNPESPVLEQVKGVNYSLKEFLGPTSLPETNAPSQIQRTNSSNTCLYQCVIYLGPGDCHRFFSPADWLAASRRHFPGKLFSVNPRYASRYPGLYTLNERVVYLGQWHHGFMSFCAVAAVGVGAIHIQSDPSLTTNHNKHRDLRFRHHGSAIVPYDELMFPPPLDMHKGDEFGYFTFGSSIVLIFEAPADVNWCVQHGERIQIGQPLLTIPESNISH